MQELIDRVVELEIEVDQFRFTRLLMAVAFVVLSGIGIATPVPDAIVVGAISGTIGVVVHFLVLGNKIEQLTAARLRLQAFVRGDAGPSR